MVIVSNDEGVGEVRDSSEYSLYIFLTLLVSAASSSHLWTLGLINELTYHEHFLEILGGRGCDMAPFLIRTEDGRLSY